MKSAAFALLLLPFACAGCSGARGNAFAASSGPPITLPSGPKHLELARPALPPSGAPSGLLSILRAELDRNFAALKKQPKGAPYFISYETIDEHSVTIAA